MSDLFRALADPTRREILLLLRDGDMTAGAIAARFAITAPSVSHHLGVLKQAGLAVDERQGRHVVYSLDVTVFQEVLAWSLRIAGGVTDRNGSTAEPAGNPAGAASPRPPSSS